MSACLSVCPSFHVEKLDSHWTEFYEILYLSVFRKAVQKIQVLLKSDKNNRYFTWRPMYIYDNIALISSYNEKCCTQNCREIQNTHFVFSKFVENRTVCEIMWKNTVQPDRPQMTIWRMRFACWIPRPTDTPWKYVIFYHISTATVVTRTWLDSTVYTHHHSCLLLCWLVFNATNFCIPLFFSSI